MRSYHIRKLTVLAYRISLTMPLANQLASCTNVVSVYELSVMLQFNATHLQTAILVT